MSTRTLAEPLVTEVHVESFKRDGYCIIDNLYSSSELDGIERFFDDWKDSPDGTFDSGGTKLRLEEVDSSKYQVRAMHPHRRHKKVADWFTHPGGASVLEVLLEKRALGVQTMFFGGNLIHGSGPNKSRTRWRRTFISHYVDEATESISKFYHPVFNMSGEVVSHVAEHAGGGPCGDISWEGSVH